MYPLLGDKEAQDTLRDKLPNQSHCKWLVRDPNACEALPAGIENATVGMVCPHNVYHHKSDLFDARDACMCDVDRIFRLIGSADAGLLSESTLDSFTVSEILAAKTELKRQENERAKKDREQAQADADAQRDRSSFSSDLES